MNIGKWIEDIVRVNEASERTHLDDKVYTLRR